MTLGIILFAITMASIAVAIVANYRNEKRRTDEFRKFASDLGLAFDHKVDSSQIRRLERFQLFSHGGSRRITNMIQGNTGEVNLSICDYRFVTRGGHSSQTHHTTLI